MPKKLLKKMMPDHEAIKNHKSLQFLGDKLHDPNLWHLSRRSISMAFCVGLFAAWLPMPGQMVVAAVAAFYFRANLPVSVALVWLTNPVTMPPLFYFAYRVGLALMGRTPSAEAFEFTLDGIASGLGASLQPFILGCLVLATTSSSLGYFGINYFWRRHVMIRWKERKQQRLTVNVGRSDAGAVASQESKPEWRG